MTDHTTPTVGKLLDPDARRDAIHMALAPVVAMERLAPGQSIGLKPGTENEATGTARHIGIVDPFLTGTVSPGERFWMFLYPMTITALRHEWEHPAFVSTSGKDSTSVDKKEESMQWLRDFVRREVGCLDDEEDLDEAVKAVIEAAEDTSDIGLDERYITVTGFHVKCGVPDEFYNHVEIVTGRVIPPALRAHRFSCSC